MEEHQYLKTKFLQIFYKIGVTFLIKCYFQSTVRVRKINGGMFVIRKSTMW